MFQSHKLLPDGQNLYRVLDEGSVGGRTPTLTPLHLCSINLSCCTQPELLIKVAGTCFLIKTSLLLHGKALSWGLWGGVDAPSPHLSLWDRWFCWAPVPSQWPNRLIHSSSRPSRPPTRTRLRSR